MNDSKSKIEEFIIKEVTSVGKPNNPNQKITFSNLAKKVDLLFELLDLRIEESSLDRVGDTFYLHVLKIVNFEIEELPSALEQLATNFEPFLKKIGYLKYKNTEYWNGNEVSIGLTKTSLLGIYLGKIDNKFNLEATIPNLILPEHIVEFSGIKQTILDFLRKELRNAVHNAKSYTRSEMIQYSNLIIGCYLIAIEDNFIFLYKTLSANQKYIKSIIDKYEYKSISDKYVELFCEKQIDSFERDYNAIKIEDIIAELEGDVVRNIDGSLEMPLTNDSIIETTKSLFYKEKSFILIGDAGSGKSTSLLYLFYQCARSIYNDPIGDEKTPLLIIANEYSSNNTFKDIIKSRLNKERVENDLNSGSLILFIDGLNEIDEKFKHSGYNELKKIINNYSNCRYILSTRQHDFINIFNLVSYKIQSLAEFQIYEFLKKYLPKNCNEVYENILENEKLEELVHNPLLLKIITVISRDGKIPRNKGLLYDTFIKALFTREKVKHHQIQIDSKIDVLSQLALFMKFTRTVSIHKEEFKEKLKQFLELFCIHCDLNGLIDEILGISIIKVSNDEYVYFVHETFLDYFVAKSLQRDFLINKVINIDFLTEDWHDTVLLCSDLLNETNLKYFSNFLFNGGSTEKVRKQINEIDKTDFNDLILLSCKVAYSNRKSSPDIYLKAEQYLYNTIVLWYKIYYKTKEEPISAEILFAAISSLNSARIIEKILTDDKWIYIWLYNSYYEKSDEIQEFGHGEQYLAPKFKNIIIEYVKNLPDFSLTYKLLQNCLNGFDILTSRSVHRNLLEFKRYLLQKTPVRFLIKYYKDAPQYDILQLIIQKDFNYINSNLTTILTSGIFNEKYILLTTIKYHTHNVEAYNLIFDNLTKFERSDKEIEDIIAISINHEESLPYLLNYVEFLIEKQWNIFQKIKAYLRKIVWRKLSPKIQSYFSNNVLKPILVDYELYNPLFQNSKPIELDLKVDSSFQSAFKNLLNQTVWNTDGIELSILAVSDLTKPNFSYVITCNLANEPTIIPLQGILTARTEDNEILEFTYVDLRLTKHCNFIRFCLEHQIEDNYEELSHISKNQILNIDTVQLQCVAKGKEIYFKTENTCVLHLSTENENIVSKRNGIIKLTENLKYNVLLIDPDKLHPEQFNDKEVIQGLMQKITEKDTIEYIKNASITHLFSDIVSVRSGIVYSINQSFAKVFCFDDQTYVDFPMPIGTILKNQDIVIIENNGNLHVKEKYSNERDFYIESIVVSVDSHKCLGFIENNGNIKDYFFSFESCNFYPTVGDKVKFIPIKNPHILYIDKPLAVKITKCN